MFEDESTFFCSHHQTFMSQFPGNRMVDATLSNEATEIDRSILADFNNEDMCNVYRDEFESNSKNRSFGYLVSFLSCNVVIGFTESIRAEGCRRVTVSIECIAISNHFHLQRVNLSPDRFF